jgi:low affinity Fe/Cu permease
MQPPSNGNGAPSLTDRFHKFACGVANCAGTPWAFMLCLLLLGAWAISGPFFGFSETWQLIINTATTIITFLMVFLIQNTQNRDARAFNLKLDELIRSTKKARNALIDLENMTDEELAEFQKQFERIGRRANGQKRNQNQTTVNTPAQGQAPPPRSVPPSPAPPPQRAGTQN